MPTMQSANRKHHFTETTLLHVTNDIIKTIDRRQDGILVLLDLSAALDTIDHMILVGRLESYFGFSKLALYWFKSYLENRRQLIVIGDQVSTPYAQRKSLSLVNVCAANLPDQIFWSPQIICVTLVEGYRGASARETRGLETAGSGSRYGNVTFEKPNPAKFFVFHLTRTQKENFLFVSLLRQRS